MRPTVRDCPPPSACCKAGAAWAWGVQPGARHRGVPGLGAQTARGAIGSRNPIVESPAPLIVGHPETERDGPVPSPGAVVPASQLSGDRCFSCEAPALPRATGGPGAPLIASQEGQAQGGQPGDHSRSARKPEITATGDRASEGALSSLQSNTPGPAPAPASPAPPPPPPAAAKRPQKLNPMQPQQRK